MRVSKQPGNNIHSSYIQDSLLGIVVETETDDVLKNQWCSTISKNFVPNDKWQTYHPLIESSISDDCSTLQTDTHDDCLSSNWLINDKSNENKELQHSQIITQSVNKCMAQDTNEWKTLNCISTNDLNDRETWTDGEDDAVICTIGEQEDFLKADIIVDDDLDSNDNKEQCLNFPIYTSTEYENHQLLEPMVSCIGDVLKKGKSIGRSMNKHKQIVGSTTSTTVSFPGVCMLCGLELTPTFKDVVYCSREACLRGMHVKCILACCSHSTIRQPSNRHQASCRPSRHVYRTDTELCGLCHLFIGELTSIDLRHSLVKQELTVSSVIEQIDSVCSNGSNSEPSSPTSAVEFTSEGLWHLRPNTSKTSEPLRTITTQMLRSLRVHIPTPKGVVVQAESYIWRVSAEAVKKRCKQQGLDGCSFRFSASGFFEARLAAIIRFNQLVKEAHVDGDPNLDLFVFPTADSSVWSTPCAQELRRVAEIQRRYNFPDSIRNVTSDVTTKPGTGRSKNHSDRMGVSWKPTASLTTLPPWITNRLPADRAHLVFPPGPIYCVVEQLKLSRSDTSGNRKTLKNKKLNLSPLGSSRQSVTLDNPNYNDFSSFSINSNNKHVTNISCDQQHQRIGQSLFPGSFNIFHQQSESHSLAHHRPNELNNNQTIMSSVSSVSSSSPNFKLPPHIGVTDSVSTIGLQQLLDKDLQPHSNIFSSKDMYTQEHINHSHSHKQHINHLHSHNHLNNINNHSFFPDVPSILQSSFNRRLGTRIMSNNIFQPSSINLPSVSEFSFFLPPTNYTQSQYIGTPETSYPYTLHSSVFQNHLPAVPQSTVNTGVLSRTTMHTPTLYTTQEHNSSSASPISSPACILSTPMITSKSTSDQNSISQHITDNSIIPLLQPLPITKHHIMGQPPIDCIQTEQSKRLLLSHIKTVPIDANNTSFKLTADIIPEPSCDHLGPSNKLLLYPSIDPLSFQFPDTEIMSNKYISMSSPLNSQQITSDDRVEDQRIMASENSVKEDQQHLLWQHYTTSQLSEKRRTNDLLMNSFQDVSDTLQSFVSSMTSPEMSGLSGLSLERTNNSEASLTLTCPLINNIFSPASSSLTSSTPSGYSLDSTNFHTAAVTTTTTDASPDNIQQNISSSSSSYSTQQSSLLNGLQETHINLTESLCISQPPLFTPGCTSPKTGSTSPIEDSINTRDTLTFNNLSNSMMPRRLTSDITIDNISGFPCETSLSLLPLPINNFFLSESSIPLSSSQSHGPIVTDHLLFEHLNTNNNKQHGSPTTTKQFAKGTSNNQVITHQPHIIISEKEDRYFDDITDLSKDDSTLQSMGLINTVECLGHMQSTTHLYNNDDRHNMCALSQSPTIDTIIMPDKECPLLNISKNHIESIHFTCEKIVKTPKVLFPSDNSMCASKSQRARSQQRDGRGRFLPKDRPLSTTNTTTTTGVNRRSLKKKARKKSKRRKQKQRNNSSVTTGCLSFINDTIKMSNPYNKNTNDLLNEHHYIHSIKHNNNYNNNSNNNIQIKSNDDLQQCSNIFLGELFQDTDDISTTESTPELSLHNKNKFLQIDNDTHDSELMNPHKRSKNYFLDSNYNHILGCYWDTNTVDTDILSTDDKDDFIDSNVNVGTILRHPKKSRQHHKTIVPNIFNCRSAMLTDNIPDDFKDLPVTDGFSDDEDTTGLKSMNVLYL